MEGKPHPEQYRVMRKCGTEPPFSGKFNNHSEKGTYVCAACATPLFASGTKYDHGTGWPSFTAPVDGDAVELREDDSLLMKRTEVRCASCGAHLGHVFNDGPAPAFDHFCINSEALNFVPKTDEAPGAGEGSKSSPEKAGAGTGFPSPTSA